MQVHLRCANQNNQLFNVMVTKWWGWTSFSTVINSFNIFALLETASSSLQSIRSMLLTKNVRFTMLFMVNHSSYSLTVTRRTPCSAYMPRSCIGEKCLQIAWRNVSQAKDTWSQIPANSTLLVGRTPYTEFVANFSLTFLWRIYEKSKSYMVQ